MIRDDLALAVRRALADAALPEPPSGDRARAAQASAIAATGPPRSRSRCRRWSAAARWRSPSGSSRRSRRPTCRIWPGPRPPSPASSTSTSRPPGCTTCCATVVGAGDAFGTSDALAGAADQPRVRLGQPDRAAARRRRALGRGGRRDREPARVAGRATCTASTTSTTPATSSRRSATRCTRATAAKQPPDDGYQGEYLVDLAARAPRRARRRRLARRRVRVGRAPHRRGPAGGSRPASACTSTRGSRSAPCTSATRSPTCCACSTRRASCFDEDGARWLRTTDFGDSRDRVLVKSDGSTTYLCNDLAYHRDKLARGSNHLIDIWGADHHGQVKSTQAGHAGARLRAAARAGGAARPAGEARPRRRRGPALEARRQHRHARRHPRRGRSRRRAHDLPAAGHRLARRRSTSTS